MAAISVNDILRKLDQDGKVKLVIEISKKQWMDNQMFRFAVTQAATFGINIHIAGVEEA
jgi:hypothetical protein